MMSGEGQSGLPPLPAHPQPMWWCDDGGTVLALNEAASRSTLLQVGAPFWAAAWPEDCPALQAAWQRALNGEAVGGEALCLDVRWLHPGGPPRWGRVLADPARAEAAVWCTLTPLDDLLDRAAVPVHREAHLRLALRASRMVVWDWDFGRGVVLFGPEQAELFGFPEDAQQLPQEQLLTMILDRDHLGAAQQAALAGGPGTVMQTEFRVQPPNRPLRWIGATGQVNSADPRRIDGVFQDITERKVQEDRLRDSLAAQDTLNHTLEDRVQARTAQLQALNDELEAFSYSVSHDLQTPLRHVTGFVGLLTRHLDPLDAQGQRYLNAIVQATGRMDTLIGTLLEFARTASQPLRRLPVPLDRVVERARQMALPHAGGPPTGGPEVQWQIGALPTVWADEATLTQVMVNLLANALKYSSQAARPLIAVRAVRLGRAWRVEVQDNGVGFDERQSGRLFGLFQRLHSGRDFEGTGVGLATVRRIVSRHGGTVSAQGSPGVGATFAFTLPDPEAPGSEHLGPE